MVQKLGNLLNPGLAHPTAAARRIQIQTIPKGLPADATKSRKTMSSPNPTTEDEVSADPATPRKPSDDNELPIPNTSESNLTTKSAPAAGRARSNTRKSVAEAPTLLHDFLRGRPSPARLAAERERRKSIEAVKAELRHEMRQSAVQRVQPPGGVKDRVKAWQKANAAAIVAGDPDDAATEPTDVAFNGEDAPSVTEEDRIRIKMRQKKRRPKSHPSKSQDNVAGTGNEETETPNDQPIKPPPRKRVVSDDHWMKNKPIKPRPRKVSPAYKPMTLPKNFLSRPAAKTPVASRVKAWAEKVEIPDTPTPRSYRSPRSRSMGPAPEDDDSLLHSEMGETVSQISSSLVTAEQSARSAPVASDRIRVKAIRKKRLDGDGIRVNPMSDASSATSRPASVRTARLRSKRAPKPQSKPSPPPSDRIEVIEEPSELSKSEVIEDIEDQPHLIEVIEEIDSLLQAPTGRKSSGRKSSGSRRKVSRTKTYYPKASKSHDDDPWVDEEENLDGAKMSDSDLLSSMISKSIADIPGEIPFGNSAFSELDLPLRGEAPRSRPKRPKVDRTTSLKTMPKMLKKVMEEGKKIIHDINEPSRPPPAANNPPSIEKWLNNTIDPFVDQSKPDHGAEAKVAPPPIDSEESSEESEPDHRPEPKAEPKLEPKLEPKHEPKSELKADRKQDPGPLNKQHSSEKDTAHEKKAAWRRSSQDSRKLRSVSSKADTAENEENTDPAETAIPESITEGTESDHEPPSRETTPKPKELKPQSSGGLKRSRAKRSSASPIKSGSKLPFLGILKEAFTGESKSLPQPPKTYQSKEQRKYEDEPEESDYYEDSQLHDDYDQSQLSSYLSSGYDSLVSSARSPPRDERRDSREPKSPTTPRMTGPRFRPPTNGYELSTILSEEQSSGVESDLSSELTNSTMTQSTLTQSTMLSESDLSHSRSQRSHRSHGSQRSQRSQRSHGSRGSQRSQRSGGLKRRLTKHSDLVSVLSLPDDQHIPTGIKSNRSRPSIRKARGGPNNVTVMDLLREFADDENLYQRELKTLVDGVIPVLLSQVVNGGNSTDLFGPGSPSRKVDGVSKSVVNMGVSLEKLKNAHRKAPLFDLRKLAVWAHGVVPIYDKYLDAWRMGFQDLIVNLAPARGIPDDQDSLLNAMPRNADGDVLDAQGERIDVAHLLKRPLLRLKQMTKFMKCVDSFISTNDTYNLLQDFEHLQNKARRRHREETARMVDEDAMNTDTTRARDLRTLDLLEYVVIDRTRQVSAKDFFSFDIVHSNGQRLECQVELIHRDNEHRPQDEGDLLIRETGDGRRTYLLFPPIPMTLISARMGETDFDLVVMIRGTHNDRPWHELLTFSTDSEDQVLDWLDILPADPVPPRDPEPSIIGDPDEEDMPRAGLADVPVGVRRSSRQAPPSPAYEPPPPPSRTASPRSPSSQYQARPPVPTTPPPPVPSSPDIDSLQKTPTQDDYDDYEPLSPEDRSRPLDESMRPDPLKLQKNPNTKSHRGDGPPLPPVHRTFSPIPQAAPKSSLKPPVDLQSSGGVKRHRSSPLKHEYLPSDSSSVSGTSTSITEESEQTRSDHESDQYSDSESSASSESSDDEIESVDLPETELGFSIADDPEHLPPVMESVVAESACSLTPSNSASQAGLHGKKIVSEDKVIRYHASISRWSEKGMWKDIAPSSLTIIVTPGLIEAYPSRVSGGPGGQMDNPTLALDLTPLVLIRQSTAVDLEIRSSVKPHCQLAEAHGGGNFRFRCYNAPDCYNLYMSVHNARLNNQKFIQLENEARFKSFGERQAPVDNDDTSSRRRNWFGRKNSYRSSVRAPSQNDGASTTPSSSLSATSFLKRLTGKGNLSFNLARSSVDRQSRASSYGNSLYSPSMGSGTPPRSPSVSVENSAHNVTNFGNEDIRIRLHLLTSGAKWEDYGNCTLQIRRPPPGWHQALRANHGLEKRVTVNTRPRKDSETPKAVLDAVLGSGCFTPMGSRGIVCGVWEEVKDDNGTVGVVPATGATGGNVKKWCFQFASPAEASWVLRLVHQEVLRV